MRPPALSRVSGSAPRINRQRIAGVNRRSARPKAASRALAATSARAFASICSGAIIRVASMRPIWADNRSRNCSRSAGATVSKAPRSVGRACTNMGSDRDDTRSIIPSMMGWSYQSPREAARNPTSRR